MEEHQRDWDDYVQPLTFAYNTQVHPSTETTPFDLVLTRPPSGLILPGTVLRDAGTHREDPRTPVQYKRATLRKRRDALDRARTKLTASQMRYKDDFDKKVRFRPVVGAGDLIYVDRPPRPLKSVARRTRAQGTTGTDELSVKLLPRTEGPFRVRSATDTTVLIEQDGLENRVSIERVTKMPLGPGILSPRPHQPNRTRKSLRQALSTSLTVLSDTMQCAAGSNLRCVGMATPLWKTPTSPPMGFCSRSSTGTGVRASKDGPHARNHALGRAFSHRSDDRVHVGGWRRQGVSGTKFVYWGRSPYWASRGKKDTRGVRG